MQGRSKTRQATSNQNALSFLSLVYTVVRAFVIPALYGHAYSRQQGRLISRIGVLRMIGMALIWPVIAETGLEETTTTLLWNLVTALW